MLKNKRLLVALVAVILLTVPRFVFVDVSQQDEVFFDPEEIPDSPGEIEGWQPYLILSCPECIEKLNEYQERKEPWRNTAKERLEYLVMDPAVDHRNPERSEESLIFLRDIPAAENNTDDENTSEEQSWRPPQNIMAVLVELVRSFDRQGQRARIPSILISRESAEVLSRKLDEAEMTGIGEEKLKELLLKILKREPVDGYEGKLYYLIDEIEEFYCPVHPDVRLKYQFERPVDPEVRANLPADTGYIDRIYRSTGEFKIHNWNMPLKLKIITSGEDRRSIHRPERCIPAQGLRPEGAGKKMEITFPGKDIEPLKVTLMRFSRHDVETGQEHKLILFYWFVSVERQTNSTFKRIFYTTWDRMVLDKNYRWSYVMVTVDVQNADEASESQALKGLYDFLRKFWPYIAEQHKGRKKDLT